MSLSTVLALSIAAREVRSMDLGGPSIIPQLWRHEQTLPDGTDAGKAEIAWSDSRSLAAAAIDALELDSLPAQGPVPARTFSKIKGIAIRNTSTGGGYLTLGGGSGGSTAPNADSWSGTDAGVVGSPFNVDGSVIRLAPGDCFVWTAQAGVSVANATGDKLGIEAFTATQTYEIAVWGND